MSRRLEVGAARVRRGLRVLRQGSRVFRLVPRRCYRKSVEKKLFVSIRIDTKLFICIHPD